MLTEEDKQILLDHANTIESGLTRIADSIPSNPDLSELCEAIRFAGEKIENGLIKIASALDRHLVD